MLNFVIWLKISLDLTHVYYQYIEALVSNYPNFITYSQML